MSIASNLTRAEELLLSHLCDKRLEYLSQQEELTSNERAEIELIQELNMKLICNTVQSKPVPEVICLTVEEVSSGTLSSSISDSMLSEAYDEEEQAWYSEVLKRTLDVVDGIPYADNVSVYIEPEVVSISIMGHTVHDNDLNCDVYEISFENQGKHEDMLIHVAGVEIALCHYLVFLTEELSDILKKSL